MKFNIEVDCTPAEARHFLGLPEVAPMQERLIHELETQMRDSIKTMDGKAMLDQWLPVGLKGVEQFQSMWTQLAAAAAGAQRTRKGSEGEGGQGGGKGSGRGRADNDDKS